MKGKQIIALIVAAVLFIVIGASNVLVQVEAEKQRATMTQETQDYFETLLGFSDSENMDYGSKLPYEDFVGVISVTDTIQNTGSVSVREENVGYDHQGTLAYIDALMESDSNQAILHRFRRIVSEADGI